MPGQASVKREHAGAARHETVACMVYRDVGPMCQWFFPWSSCWLPVEIARGFLKALGRPQRKLPNGCGCLAAATQVDMNPEYQRPKAQVAMGYSTHVDEQGTGKAHVSQGS